MDNKITIVFWMYLMVDIGSSRRGSWRGLFSRTVILTIYGYDRDWLRTNMSTLKTALMSEDFPEPFCD